MPSGVLDFQEFIKKESGSGEDVSARLAEELWEKKSGHRAGKPGGGLRRCADGCL